MTIQDIYDQYNIMSNLQMHQLRVAGVARLISESMIYQTVDKSNIVIACLLHDMGNIIKFKLDLFPEFLKPEGLDYWKKIQEKFVDTYGKDEHVATMRIARKVLIHDAGFMVHESKRILELIDAIGFANAKQNYELDDFGKKIVAYSDMRVTPYGVNTLEKRLEDGSHRFIIRKPTPLRRHFFEEMSGYLKKIEGQIFAKSSLRPEDISEEVVQMVIPKVQSTLHTHSIDQKDRKLS